MDGASAAVAQMSAFLPGCPHLLSSHCCLLPGSTFSPATRSPSLPLLPRSHSSFRIEVLGCPGLLALSSGKSVFVQKVQKSPLARVNTAAIFTAAQKLGTYMRYQNQLPRELICADPVDEATAHEDCSFIPLPCISP